MYRIDEKQGESRGTDGLHVVFLLRPGEEIFRFVPKKGKEIMDTKHMGMAKALAIAAFLAVTIIWGSTFVVMKNSIDMLSPAYVLAYRFTIASLGLAVLFHRRLIHMNRRDLHCGIVLGVLLGMSYVFQTYGLQHTTASKNAFITTLYVIIVPFLHWVLNGVKPRKNNLTAAVLAVIGLAFISLNGEHGINLGDVLTFLCSVFLAWHMVYVDRYTRHRDPVLLTVLQIMVSALLFWVLAFATEGVRDVRELLDWQTAWPLLYLGLIASMLGFLVQNVGQKYLSPNTASILLSFESVFGLIFSVIFLKETVTAKMLAGCVLMFAAAVISEYRAGS